MIETTIIGSEFTKKIFLRWLVDSGYESQLSVAAPAYLFKTLRGVSPRDGLRRRFDDWLWKQGGLLKQKNGKLYIEFIDPEFAVLFSLKWLK
jgi:hypothetical protein